MYATKEAIMAIEHERDTAVHIFMMDMRAFSKGYEEYYRRAQHKYGIHPESVVKLVTALPNFADLNSLPYMHTVIPNLRGLGLITERTRDRWIKLGMMTEKRVEAA
jgi:hypothetical protein